MQISTHSPSNVEHAPIGDNPLDGPSDDFKAVAETDDQGIWTIDPSRWYELGSLADSI